MRDVKKIRQEREIKREGNINKRRWGEKKISYQSKIQSKRLHASE